MKKERQLNATRRDLLRGALGVSALANVISQAAKRDPTLIKRANEKHRERTGSSPRFGSISSAVFGLH
jgi:hypothetical protein